MMIRIISFVLASIASIYYVSVTRETLPLWQILLFAYIPVTLVMYLLRWLNFGFQWIKSNKLVLLWGILFTGLLYAWAYFILFAISLVIAVFILWIIAEMIADVERQSHETRTPTNQSYNEGYDPIAYEAIRQHNNRIADENARRARAAGQYRKANSYERDKY